MKKGLMFYLILAIAVLSVSFFAYIGINYVKAGAEHNILGWAWSENIGWISFNNSSGGGGVNYGVNVGTNGDLSGHAWSENIGWISFNQADTGAPPSDDPCGAACIANASPSGQIGKSDVYLSGWARALSHNASWDGWIRFDHSQANPVKIDDKAVFKGWAWGGDVVGWLSFNCANYPEGVGSCATSNYKVLILGPPVNLSESFYPCSWGTPQQIIAGSGLLVNLSWDYFGGVDGYEIWLDNEKNFIAPRKFNHKVEGVPSVSYNLSFLDDDNGDWDASDFGWGKTYYWKVSVKDGNSGQWSEFSDVAQFTITQAHPYPNTKFSWSPQNPTVDEVVYFTDETIFHNGGSWLWDLGDGSPATTTQNPIHPYSLRQVYSVNLQATDGDGYSCSKTLPVSVGWMLPKWKEVKP